MNMDLAMCGTKASGVSHPKQFELRVKDTFRQHCFSDMSSSHRCLLYKSLERDFEIATYLKNIHIRTNRIAMSRLRMSSHTLLIERGTWLKIPPNVRLCDECNVLEDEYHVMYL